jgi:hypothetical protein
MDKMVKTNDIKKGARIQLACGWYATMFDNAKGTIRMATVEGFETETGSVYSHDIVAVKIGDAWDTIEYTPDQLKLRKQVSAMGW